MKKHLRRRLRATLSQLLAAETLWAVHEPALGALYGALTLGPDLDRPGLAAVLGMSPQPAMADICAADNSPPTTQMVGSIAVLPIFGVLSQKASWLTRALGWTATETLERDFRDAVASSQVKAIVFYVDSPGGSAIGNEEVSRTIFQSRDKKPVYAFVRGICASAAYYLASAASRVVASPSSSVGSIGAVSTHVEYSKALAEAGYGVNVIRSAPHKQLWNQFEKLTPEARATLQKWVGDYGSQFEQAVARHRGVSQADVRTKFGQGDVFLAAEAQQRGLIDGVSSWEQLLATVQKGIAAPLPSTGDDDGSDNGVARKAFDSVVVRGTQLAVAGVASLPDLVADWPAAAEAAYLSASGIPAAASAVPVTQPPAKAPEASTTMTISTRVRAALFARGLIAAQDSDDGVCMAALTAYFAGRGEECPKEDEKRIAALMTAPLAAAPATAPAAAAAPAANVTAAHEREMLEAREAGRKTEQQRQTAIRASAKLLKLPEASIAAAIESSQTHEQIVAAWHVELAGKEKPISQGGGNASVGQEGIERYLADATLAVQLHFGMKPAADTKITPEIRQLAGAPLHAHAAQCLAAANIRHDPYDREAICEAAMEMDGQQRFRIEADGGIAYNRPGSFPNLLSALANKILDQGIDQAEATYEEWTGVKPTDLPDFKPVPIVAKGKYGELDEVLDAEEFKEQKLDEELLSYMQLARYGNAFALTPVMAANDDLDAFTEDLIGLSEGWELKQNRGCLSLVTGNAYLLDTYQLYDDTNHANHISSGGAAPGDAEWDKMQIKMAKQTTIGGKAYARARLSIALVPPALERAALQAFLPFRDIGENKEPATDSNLNVYRGRVTVVTEPELTATSEVEWYGFADPRRFNLATIIRSYFRGFPRKGRRERWYDPKTKCYWVSLEGRVGFAAKNYRTTVKDKGAA